MSTTAYKRKLSGSTDGKAIKVAASAASGTVIHSAVAGTTAGTFDEIWLWAYNSHTSDLTVTIEFGGTSTPDDVVTVTVPYQSGLIPVIPGLVLQNNLTVRAYAQTANLVTIIGFVNTMTD